MAVARRKSINLLLIHDKDSPRVRRVKKIMPIAATVSVLLFLTIFLVSLAYTNIHINEFNALKREVEVYEKRISGQKKIEQVYTISSRRIDIIQEILSATTPLSGLLSHIANLQGGGIKITSSTIDTKGNVSFAFSAENHELLSSFIDSLVAKEEQDKLFSGIRAHGIVRDKKGNYIISISLTAKV